MKRNEIISVINNIKYKDWSFDLQEKNDGYNLQAILSNGEKSGKWYISPHISKSELVQRCFLCVSQAEEHETRKSFKYKDESIFNPHFNVDDLVKLSKKSEDKRNSPKKQQKNIEKKIKEHFKSDDKLFTLNKDGDKLFTLKLNTKKH